MCESFRKMKLGSHQWARARARNFTTSHPNFMHFSNSNRMNASISSFILFSVSIWIKKLFSTNRASKIHESCLFERNEAVLMYFTTLIQTVLQKNEIAKFPRHFFCARLNVFVHSL
eukprot:UN15429